MGYKIQQGVCGLEGKAGSLWVIRYSREFVGYKIQQGVLWVRRYSREFVGYKI